MSWHPTSRAFVSANNPEAFGQCARCNFTYQHNKLRWQFQWAGTQLQNLQILVCPSCYDIPQPQLKALVLPADPLPIMNPRPDFYHVEVPSYMSTLENVNLTTMTGVNLVMMSQITPTPDPNDPYLVPADF